MKSLARIVRRLLPAGYTAQIDAGQVRIDETTTGGHYHLVFSRNPSREIARAMDAFRQRAAKKRRRRNKQIDDWLKSHSDRVWITADDSVAAGNCRYGTDEFRNRICRYFKTDGELGAVRADVALSLRDDIYVRRAARVAAVRVMR